MLCYEWKLSTTGWLTVWLVSVISWQRFVERKPVRIHMSASKRTINQSSSPKQCDVLLDLDSNWTTIATELYKKARYRKRIARVQSIWGKLLVLPYLKMQCVAKVYQLSSTQINKYRQRVSSTSVNDQPIGISRPFKVFNKKVSYR